MDFAEFGCLTFQFCSLDLEIIFSCFHRNRFRRSSDIIWDG